MFYGKLLLCASVFAIISRGQGYTYITEISTHPDFPDKCYDAETKTSYSKGESFKYFGKCEEATCDQDFRFSVRGCGVVDVSSIDCIEYSQDYSLPYPLCCQKYKCTSENGITINI